MHPDALAIGVRLVHRQSVPSPLRMRFEGRQQGVQCAGLCGNQTKLGFQVSLYPKVEQRRSLLDKAANVARKHPPIAFLVNLGVELDEFSLDVAAWSEEDSFPVLDSPNLAFGKSPLQARNRRVGFFVSECLLKVVPYRYTLK